MFSAKLKLLKSRHNNSQPPVSGLEVLYLTGNEISRFSYVKAGSRKIVSKLFLLYLSVHCRDFIEQIRDNCHIHFKSV